MNFMPDVYVQCEICNGRRYNQETLAVKFKGHSIADILELTIEDALTVLADVPQVRQKLQTLVDVGLGYVHLGQSATTLSGGEAQRMKLARELSKRQTGRTLYLLDEPTTGLHFDDVRRLLEVLHRLADLGNTVIIIEHNLDVIRNADWILDLGPEGGEDGGRVVGEGRPAKIAATPASYTGQFLARYYKSSNGQLEAANAEELFGHEAESASQLGESELGVSRLGGSELGANQLGAPSIPQHLAEWVGNHEPEPEKTAKKPAKSASNKRTAAKKTAAKKTAKKKSAPRRKKTVLP
jgi:excinuclease ABC subunit A